MQKTREMKEKSRQDKGGIRKGLASKDCTDFKSTRSLGRCLHTSEEGVPTFY